MASFRREDRPVELAICIRGWPIESKRHRFIKDRREAHAQGTTAVTPGWRSDFL